MVEHKDLVLSKYNNKKYKTLGNEDSSEQQGFFSNIKDRIDTFRETYDEMKEYYGAAKVNTSLGVFGAVGASLLAGVGYLIYKGGRTLYGYISNIVGRMLDKRQMRKTTRTVTFDEVGNENIQDFLVYFPIIASITAVTFKAISGVIKGTKSFWKSREKQVNDLSQPPRLSDKECEDIVVNYTGYFNMYKTIQYVPTDTRPIIVQTITNEVETFSSLPDNLLSSNKSALSIILEKEILISNVQSTLIKTNLDRSANLINQLVSVFIPYTSLITRDQTRYFNVSGKFERGQYFSIISLYDKLTYIWLDKIDNGIIFGMDFLEYQRINVLPLIEDTKQHPMYTYAEVENLYENSPLSNFESSTFASYVKQYGGDIMEDFGAKVIMEKAIKDLDFTKSSVSKEQALSVINPILNIVSTIYIEHMKLKLLNVPRMSEDIGALLI